MTEVAIPTEPFADMMAKAKALAPADLLPPSFRGKPANILLAIETSHSLGKTLMDVIQNAHVINGKLGFSAEFQRALVLESGHKLRVFMDGDTAVAQGIRSDDPTFTYEVRWTIERAKAAGMSSDNWKKHPHAMLKARATTELCRDAFADVIRGFRSTEELVDIEPTAATSVTVTAADLTGEPEVVDAEIVPDEPMITDAQMRKMQATFTDKGFKDRDDRLAYVALTLDREVASSKDLTKVEAGKVIEALDALSDAGADQ